MEEKVNFLLINTKFMNIYEISKNIKILIIYIYVYIYKNININNYL